MNVNQAIPSKLYCTACEVFLGSKASYALHVLTKEHCENVMKLLTPELKNSKNGRTSSATKTSETTLATVAHTKSTSIFPYNFVSGELCPINEGLKEMDYVKYGRFWQKLAEDFNEEIVNWKSEIINTTLKKSLISCEICNIILTKTVEYEYHVNSPEHISNVKLHQMGVSVDVIKAFRNFCKMNAVEVSKNIHQVKQNDLKQRIPMQENISLIPFPLLYCDACELLINTPQQFNTHVNGRPHKLCVQKKGKMKIKKVQFPVPNKYYCYSCGLVLTGISQYNQHKTGRKHKVRCTQLLQQGFTIPPEEQLPEWNLPKVSPNKPIRYPQFYEKFVLLKQELSNCSEFKELLMNGNSSGNSNCIRTVDGTTPIKISGVQNLYTQKSESTPQHIYRIQNKNMKNFSPDTRSNYYFRDS